jgi:amino acid adenylation domain-containing protein
VITEVASVELPVEDLAHLARTDAEAQALHLAYDEAVRPFDLTGGPLMRAHLARLGDEDHFLILNFHHAVIDGWSMIVFWRELAHLYDQFANGGKEALAPLPIQYTDYAAWQRSQLDGDGVAVDLEYWRQMLDGAPPFMDLPTDLPRPRMLSGAGSRIHFIVPDRTAEELRKIAVNHNSTMFVVLLVAFDVLLSRYVGRSDIVTGIPIAGRMLPELEGLIGFFVNSIPLRVRWSGDRTFVELLHVTRATVLEAFAHSDTPFEYLVEELVADRDLSRNPIFQIWFDVDSSPQAAQPDGLRVIPVPLEVGNTRFDLEMRLDDRLDGLVGSLCYSTDIFSARTARRLVQHFEQILAAIANGSHQRLSRLAALDDDQYRQVLLEWNSPGLPVPVIDDVIDCFEARVAGSPVAVALACGGETLTYAELDAGANRLARYLRGLGVGPEVVVGVCVNRGFAAVVSLLAVMKAGGVYLPLDSRHPGERLGFMVADAGARLVLAEVGVMGGLWDFGCPVVVYEEVLDEVAAVPAVPLVRGVGADNAMYVVYTSGSTGQPKGIAATGWTLRNFTAWRIASGPPAPSCVQLASVGFDVSLQEVFGTLVAGGTLMLVEEEHRQDPGRLLELLSSERVDRVYLSPALLHQVALSWAAQPQPLALREIIVGGEPLQLSAEERAFIEAVPGVVLENQYGPSETHHATSLRLSGAVAGWPTAPSIGRPISGVRVYVLDEGLCPVPVGGRGEIYIGGGGLARGYVGRPGLTAQRFVADPFAAAGLRMYRTGDVARWSAEGLLEFLGRVDDQVKIRGFRVEPGEVEAVIAEHPAVQDVAVVARTGAGGPQLVAYSVLAQGAVLKVDQLRDFVRLRLPEYMVPGSMVVLPVLPLTRNGKVDRGSLPEPSAGRPDLVDAFVGPRNVQEETLREIWADVLGIADIGIDDNFFALGGHSLLATQVISRVRKAFQLTLPVRVLFEEPTIRRLAQKVEERVVAEVAALSPEEVRNQIDLYGSRSRARTSS